MRRLVTAAWDSGRTEEHEAVAVECEEGQYKVTLAPGDFLLVPKTPALLHVRVQEMVEHEPRGER